MSTVPTVNIEKLGSHWNLGKEKVYEVLEILQHVGVINIVYRDGSKEVGKGAKIFLADPSLYHVLNTRNLGTEREAFFVMNVRALGKKVYAAKNETQADFIVDGISYEVGGQSKKRKRADFVVRDGDDVPTRTSIPMWCLAFGY